MTGYQEHYYIYWEDSCNMQQWGFYWLSALASLSLDSDLILLFNLIRNWEIERGRGFSAQQYKPI